MTWNLMLLTQAAAPAGGADGAVQPGAGDLLGMMLPMVLIFVVFYFFMIRPQRKKDKAAKEMLKQLKVGDNVCTIGGIHGTISSIKDDVLTLAVGADKVKLVFARWAIRNVEEISIANEAESLI